MAIPVRINEELYDLLSIHAQADGRSIIKELEIILVLYFDEIDNPTPLTNKKIRTDRDVPTQKPRLRDPLLEVSKPRLEEPYTGLKDRTLPTLSWVCKHGIPGKTCKHSACNVEARRRE